MTMRQVLLLGAFFTSVYGSPVVEGPLGRITGKIETILDVEIESFLGIPYAKPPVGELRFALPEAFGAVGDLQATEYSTICPQPNRDVNATNRWFVEEDCLYLNVFRRRGTSANDKKAVIAIVHGGGFVIGSASDSYANAVPIAARGDVILVSFNYRLGIFGFADMKDLAPGNLGLHDQRLALQWIQDHIAEFGGDPERVTAIGVSAGSMSLSAQIVTPVDDRNLFRSAVLDAGVIGGFFEDSESSYTRVIKIAKQLECPIGSSEMVACLRKARVEDLLPLSFSTTGVSGLNFFVPTTDDVFLPNKLEEYVDKNSAKLRKVRTIVGCAKDEGTFFTGPSLLDHNFPDPRTKEGTLEYMQIVSSSYNHPLDYSNERTRKTIAELYVDKYPGNSFRAVAELQGDAVFKCPVNNFVRSYSRHNDEVYVYQFDRKLHQPGNLWGFDPEKLGAFHASPYVHFSGSLLLAEVPVGPEDQRYSLDAIDMISNFAKTDEAPTFREKSWPTFSNSEEIFVFDDTSSVRKGLFNEEICRQLFAASTRSNEKESRSEL